MDKIKLDIFFEQLEYIVGDDAPWKEKKETLLAEASDDDKTNLAEFVTWFESEEDLEEEEEEEEVDPKEDT